MLSHTETVFIHAHIVFGSQGAGTDDDVLIEIMASRTGEQIQDIVKVYKKGETKAYLISVFLLLFVSKAGVSLRFMYPTMLNECFNSIKSLQEQLNGNLTGKLVFSDFLRFNVSACCSEIEAYSCWMRSEVQHSFSFSPVLHPSLSPTSTQ